MQFGKGHITYTFHYTITIGLCISLFFFTAKPFALTICTDVANSQTTYKKQSNSITTKTI